MKYARQSTAKQANIIADTPARPNITNTLPAIREIPNIHNPLRQKHRPAAPPTKTKTHGAKAIFGSDSESEPHRIKYKQRSRNIKTSGCNAGTTGIIERGYSSDNRNALLTRRTHLSAATQEKERQEKGNRAKTAHIPTHQNTTPTMISKKQTRQPYIKNANLAPPPTKEDEID